MRVSTVPITSMRQFMQDVGRQLAALNSLQLPEESLHAVRLIQLQRLARRIEAVISGHFGHGERTAHYALLLAARLKLTNAQQCDLHYAALLHDIGLLTLSKNLTSTAGPLTMNDYALVQSHPREGAALLYSYAFLRESARLIAHHHERWDGAGYPHGLRGEYIPLSARILAIADSFDTIATRSIALHTAVRTLRAAAGSQFDPTLSATFSELLRHQDRRQPWPLTETTIVDSNTEPPSIVPAPSHRSLPMF